MHEFGEKYSYQGVEFTVLFEDNHLLVVSKQSGDLTQPDPSGNTALEDAAKAYLRDRYNKTGEAFLGVVHRIDRPVSGVVVLAKTSKALSRLNEQLREGGFKKEYLAIVENRPPRNSDRLEGYIARNGKLNKSYVLDTEKQGAKKAVLEYSLIGESDRYFLLRVNLLTGRHHQIRAQLSHLGCPIRGDVKYGARRSLPSGGISLHSHTLTLLHPTLKTPQTIIAPPPTETDKLWKEFNIQ